MKFYPLTDRMNRLNIVSFGYQSKFIKHYKIKTYTHILDVIIQVPLLLHNLHYVNLYIYMIISH